MILENFCHLLQKVISHTDIQHVIITSVGDMLPFSKRTLVNTVVKYVKKMVPDYNLPLAVRFNEAMEQGKNQSFDPAKLGPDDIAFFAIHWGTTGVAKGAILTHRNIVANMLQAFEWFKPRLKRGEEISLVALPLYHVFL